MKKIYWLCLFWLVSLLSGCQLFALTPPPPKPGGVPDMVRHVSIENQADSFIVSFYLTDGEGKDTVWDGTALLQVINPARVGCSHQPTEPYSDEIKENSCLLFRQVAEVKVEDFVWSKRTVFPVIDEPRDQWHYWYSFPSLRYDAALEEVLGGISLMVTYETGGVGRPPPQFGGLTVEVKDGQFQPVYIAPGY